MEQKINTISNIIDEMIKYYSRDPKRINHFIKVYTFAKIIGELEKLDEKTQLILEIAAIMHDIGIKVSEIKYNSSAGRYQEVEGPSVAKEILDKLDFPKDVRDRVCFLVGHHHTYKDIDGADFQILVESDLLVNSYEENMNALQIELIKNKIFKTSSGIRILSNMYLK